MCVFSSFFSATSSSLLSLLAHTHAHRRNATHTLLLSASECPCVGELQRQKSCPKNDPLRQNRAARKNTLENKQNRKTTTAEVVDEGEEEVEEGKKEKESPLLLRFKSTGSAPASDHLESRGGNTLNLRTSQSVSRYTRREGERERGWEG